MNVKITNLSRAPLRLSIPGVTVILPGDHVVVDEFHARRAQLQSAMRTGRVLIQNAKTGKTIGHDSFRPEPKQGSLNLLGRLEPIPIPSAYVQADRKKYEGDFYEFEDHDNTDEAVEKDLVTETN